MIRAMRWLVGWTVGVAILLTLAVAYAGGPRLHPERWYQEQWCREHGGAQEVVMPNGSRCDCLTATHAIEFDFADKFKEGVAQALEYSCQTGLAPGLVLIVEHPGDRRYVERARAVNECKGLGITIWELSSNP